MASDSTTEIKIRKGTQNSSYLAQQPDSLWRVCGGRHFFWGHKNSDPDMRTVGSWVVGSSDMDPHVHMLVEAISVHTHSFPLSGLEPPLICTGLAAAFLLLPQPMNLLQLLVSHGPITLLKCLC